MIVKNDYSHCLTNLANSIRKYFGLKVIHSTLPPVDEVLERRQPENVVLFLLDGMGNNILNRTLSEDSFFIRNRKDVITSVFPPTTTAATTTVCTGYNPAEHCWLGWNTYIKPIDKVITMFRDMEKGKNEPCEEFLAIKDKYYALHEIDEEINEKGQAKGMKLYPFGENPYADFDDLLDIVEKQCSMAGRKYIYAYDTQPDHDMHNVGPDARQVQDIIRERNDKIEKLVERLENTVVIIVADHGHVVVDNIVINDYPDIYDMLERTTSIEQRAVSFKVRDGMKEQFVEKFNQYFGKDFTLYTAQDVIDSQLFGDGEIHPYFKDAVGDFLAIAYNSNRAIMTSDEWGLFSTHAGLHDDELYVPLIIIER